ncbi:MAG: adaptor protein MecA [Ruminococcaceae bacterium]|nr:adaptor protein MecA [Oscillospiraceae bacterium]
MEWIRISQNKLKIMLTAEDTRHYELNCDNTDYADLLTRTAFQEILTDVRKETDFDASEDKIYIQMYPSKGGGCELFVTKVGLLLTNDGAQSATTLLPRRKERLRRESELQLAFRFETLEPLLLLCRRMRLKKGTRKSEAWQDEKGRWWLLFSAPPEKKPAYAAEYGKEIRADSARLYLAEHGRMICKKDAIETLARM